MIDRHQLRELHNQELPLHILEQDYIQALVLTELYRETEALVFKGDTYLKHAHGLDRFSEDLDFTRSDDVDVARVFHESATTLDRYGVRAELDRFERGPAGFSGRLRYDGPLYDGTDRSRGSIEIEISCRDDLVQDPEWTRLFFPYPEARAVTARCLPIAEAFAEKLRALTMRSSGRDLYDSWFLIKQGVEPNADLFESKMYAVDESPMVEIAVTQTEWERDLSVLVERPPPYRDAIEILSNALKNTGIPFEIME